MTLSSSSSSSSSCCFKFMKHDKWSNVLFLHWRIPADLEPLLQSQCGGGNGEFELDRTADGTCWVGLILLTEQNVGPAFGRSNKKLLVTHHGVNVRTYVKGVMRDASDEYHQELRGIHFSSLECDDFITAWGANWFGMPYKLASIERRFGIVGGSSGGVNGQDTEYEALIKQNALTSNEIDDILCQNGSTTNCRVKKLSLTSVRSKTRAEPSLSSQFGSIVGSSAGAAKGDKVEHSAKLDFINESSSSSPKGSAETTNDRDSYTVECDWERCPDDELSDIEQDLAQFFVERYHVYTRKYGLNWRGTVTHEPWPVEHAELVKLAISNIDCYEPKAMQPIIQHMAKTEPDSVLFSPGVGPIDFQMLQPVLS